MMASITIFAIRAIAIRGFLPPCGCGVSAVMPITGMAVLFASACGVIGLVHMILPVQRARRLAGPMF